MTDKEILAQLGIDDSLPSGELKQALEKKKQGLLRKINAVYGNSAKEQELNSQLNQVEELIINYSVKQISEGISPANENSSLLSSIDTTSTISMSQFDVSTRELSQSREEIPPHCFEYNIFGTVKIEEGVERIASDAFCSCTFDKLFLPSTLEKIALDNSSFGYCRVKSEFRAPASIKPLIEKQLDFHLETARVTYFD